MDIKNKDNNYKNNENIYLVNRKDNFNTNSNDNDNNNYNNYNIYDNYNSNNNYCNKPNCNNNNNTNNNNNFNNNNNHKNNKNNNYTYNNNYINNRYNNDNNSNSYNNNNNNNNNDNHNSSYNNNYNFVNNGNNYNNDDYNNRGNINNNNYNNNSHSYINNNNSNINNNSDINNNVNINNNNSNYNNKNLNNNYSNSDYSNDNYNNNDTNNYNHNNNYKNYNNYNYNYNNSIMKCNSDNVNMRNDNNDYYIDDNNNHYNNCNNHCNNNIKDNDNEKNDYYNNNYNKNNNNNVYLRDTNEEFQDEVVFAAQRKGKQNKEKYKGPYKETQRLHLKDNPVPIHTPAMKQINNNNDNYNDSNNNEELNNNKIIEGEYLSSTKKVNFRENPDIIEINNNGNIRDEDNMNLEDDPNNLNYNNNNNHNINIDDYNNNINNNDNSNNINNNNNNNNNNINDNINTNNDSNNNTEKLEHLDISYINQPNISNAKKINKLNRIKEIISNTTNENENGGNTKTSKLEKHIKMINLVDNYDINDLVKDVANIEVKLKLAHLLDLCPKFRTGFNKEQKLIKSTSKEFLINALSLLSDYKVIKVNGTIEGSYAEIFLDSCASVNLITAAAFEKYKINKTAVGTISERIFQAYSNNYISSDVYELEIEIGGYTFKDYFRKIEKDDIFDVLIGINTLKKNRFVLDLVDDTLLRKNDNGDFIELSNLMYNVNFSNVNDLNINKNDSENYVTRCDGIINYCACSNFLCNDTSNINISDFDNLILSNDEVLNNNDLFSIDNNVLFLNNDSKICPAILLITSDDNSSFVDLKSLQNDKKISLVHDILSEVPSSIRDSIKILFLSYTDILAVKTDDLGNSKLFPHRINLVPGTHPVKQRAYRLSKVQADALKKEIIKLINNKLIVPSNSPWSSPVVLVLKKNGQVRMCVDYRVVNNYTKKDTYALPIIDDILYYVGNTAVLSTIDLFSGYHQIPMHPDDRDITCFTTIYGNFNFQVMPFGLCNAPATFQREMNRIFFDLIGVCVFVYIDDLVVYSPSMDQHIKDLEKVFKILHNNGLKINLEKCHFFKEEVELLGHKLSTKGISPIDSKVNVIMNWLPPKNIKQLRSFLGAIGYYRKFIYNFAQIAKPLYELTKKNVPFVWTDTTNKAFVELKNKIISAPILSPPVFEKPFIIRTDASKYGIGGVLIQLDENNDEKPIYFESRTLVNAELNYSITDLEGLAAYYCVMKFRPFLTGNNFETILYTDHKPLVYIFNSKEPTSSRHIKWITEFSILKVKVLYEEGRRNVIADALSRLNSGEDIQNKNVEENKNIILENNFNKDNNSIKNIILKENIRNNNSNEINKSRNKISRENTNDNLFIKIDNKNTIKNSNLSKKIKINNITNNHKLYENENNNNYNKNNISDKKIEINGFNKNNNFNTNNNYIKNNNYNKNNNHNENSNCNKNSNYDKGNNPNENNFVGNNNRNKNNNLNENNDYNKINYLDEKLKNCNIIQNNYSNENKENYNTKYNNIHDAYKNNNYLTKETSFKTEILNNNVIQNNVLFRDIKNESTTNENSKENENEKNNIVNQNNISINNKFNKILNIDKNINKKSLNKNEQEDHRSITIGKKKYNNILKIDKINNNFTNNNFQKDDNNEMLNTHYNKINNDINKNYSRNILSNNNVYLDTNFVINVTPNNNDYNNNNNNNNNNNEINNNENNNDDEKFLNDFIDNYIKQKFVEIDGIIYYKQNNNLRRVIFDEKEKWKLINLAHNVGHEGCYKTYHRLKRDYFWKGMNKDIKIFIKCCKKCQMYKPQPQNKYPEDIPTPPGLPFTRVGLDLVGPLYTTARGNRYIIVLVDYLTKWVEAEPLEKTESEDVIRFLINVFSRHGIPELLITDNGPQLISDKTKAFLDLHDVYVHNVATYHPPSNGEVENRNREIGKYLRLLGKNNKDWDDILPSALWALRTAKNEVTKYSSFELLYGRRDLQPFELTINVDQKHEDETDEEYYLRKFITHNKWINEAIRNIETANELWKDRRKQIKRLRSEFKPGDLVLIRNFNRRKLDPYFIGPLKIVKQQFNTVTVCDPISNK